MDNILKLLLLVLLATFIKAQTNCATLEPPSNGYVTLKGNKAEFRCQPGYELIGSETIKCIKIFSLRFWFGVAPLCVPSIFPTDSNERVTESDRTNVTWQLEDHGSGSEEITTRPVTEHPSTTRNIDSCKPASVTVEGCFIMYCNGFRQWERASYLPTPECCAAFRQRPTLCQNVKNMDIPIPEQCTNGQRRLVGCDWEICTFGKWIKSSIAVTEECCRKFDEMLPSCSFQMCRERETVIMHCYLYVCVSGMLERDVFLPSADCCSRMPWETECLPYSDELSSVVAHSTVRKESCSGGLSTRTCGCFGQRCIDSIWVNYQFLPSFECCAAVKFLHQECKHFLREEGFISQ